MKYFVVFQNTISRKTEKYLAKDPKFFEGLIFCIKAVKSIQTTAEYNAFIKRIITLFRKRSVDASSNFPLYDAEKFAIRNSKPLTEKTLWGGVSLKKVDTRKNYIEKLLVVDTYGVLGFELHRKKYEKLRILEGFCMILYSNHADRNWRGGHIYIKFCAQGDTFEFLPNDEHGILALTECVIQEKSTNNLDDLVYIFPTSQLNSEKQ